MNPAWRARYELAVAAATRAAHAAHRYFEQGHLLVDRKADASPVTIADREAEQLIRRIVSEAFPDDGFLGEEHGDQPGTSGYRWIIDPIDGTQSFIRGIPLWATLVGIEYRDAIIAGVAVVPALQRTYRALRGEGAFVNDRPLQVSAVGSLEEAFVCYSSLQWFLNAGREQAFIELVRRTHRQRGYGDFYGFVLVAEGAAEAMVDSGLSPWDVAALIPIVEEAGGKWTNWHGGRDWSSPDVLASNGCLHDAILAIWNR